MKKQTFLDMLKKRLSGLPKQEIAERLTFYSEMIDDRMEEGMSEEEAVASVGSVDEIVSQTLTDMPSANRRKKGIQLKRQRKTWEIVLLAVGSPLWLVLGIAGLAVAFSLAIAGLAVVFSLYAVAWAVLVCLWAVFGALIGCAFAGVVSAIVFVCTGTLLTGVAMLAAGLVCGGFSVFFFHGCKETEKGTIWLTKKMTSWIKNCFKKKEKI